MIGLLSFVTMGFGYWLCSQYGNYKTKYFKQQLKKALIFANGLKDTVEVLSAKIERMEAMGIIEDPKCIHAQIDSGILTAIEYRNMKQNEQDGQNG
jgi:hypothetical protein